MVAGDYSLAASSVRREIAASAVRGNMPELEPVPIILLGRLAADRNWQGCDLGGFLRRDAALCMLQAAGTIGVHGMVLSGIGDAAISFYQQHGFRASVIERVPLMITVTERTRMLSAGP